MQNSLQIMSLCCWLHDKKLLMVKYHELTKVLFRFSINDVVNVVFIDFARSFTRKRSESEYTLKILVNTRIPDSVKIWASKIWASCCIKPWGLMQSIGMSFNCTHRSEYESAKIFTGTLNFNKFKYNRFGRIWILLPKQ